MNLISANATNSAIFQNIAISLSCIAMLVALTKERIVKTVAGRCGSVLIPLSLCSIALHADLLIFNRKKVYPEMLGHLMTEFSAVLAYNPITGGLCCNR
jgi:hydrogenase-4 membrane subunit HyfE